ncbi:MAG: hypothetical protein WCG86_06660 [Actinomycetota bacterium]|jgi:hypothetical protein
MAYGFGKINFDYVGFLVNHPVEADGPVFMVNFMKYKPIAIYSEPREVEITGQEADDLYAPVDVLERIGADVAFHGPVVSGNSDEWHRMGIVRYPTRQSFIEMQNRPDFLERFVHKEAGMEFTIVMGALPQAAFPEGVQPQPLISFVALPPDTYFDGVSNGIVMNVEGVVIGDHRRFDRLAVFYGEANHDLVPAGAVSVTAACEIDEMLRLVAHDVRA